MSAFSVNQVRQLYVVNTTQTAFTSIANPGDITVGSNKSGEIYLKYVGALGDTMRSDLMKVSSIKYAKATPASDLAYKIKAYKITLDANVNGGVPVPGQDYLLRLAFREYVGVSPADQYFVYGMYHAFTGATALDLIKGIAMSLAKNMAKEVNPLVTIQLKSTSQGWITVTSDTTKEYIDGFSDLDTALYILEAGQPWHLGIMAQGVIPFTVQFPKITVDGDQREWGTAEKYQPLDPLTDKPLVLPEGQKIADLEWFAMGERGDQYRLVGWPNVIPTKYMVDPTKDYDIIDIHYYWVGPNEQAQKSEKDIQIAVPVDADGGHDNTNALITAINAAIQAVDPDKAGFITALE